MGGQRDVVLGAAGVLAGGGTSLYGTLSDHWAVEAADPLSDWLPTEDFWGKNFAADRDSLLKAVRPDPSAKAKLSSKTVEGKKLPKAMTEQAKAVTERAFYFPTGVDVWTPEPGAAPVGLQLDIAVAYLPSYGTLMVDASVIPSTQGLVEKPIQCAVHYVQNDGSFYYCVVPKEGRLKLPDTKEKSLSEWASSDPDWAEAPTGPVEFPDGERGHTTRLQVPVGQWPDASEYREDMQSFAQHVLRLQKSRSGHLQAEVKNREQLQEVARSAPPQSMIDGPEGLGAILQSGQFRVTGDVYFAPLQPFQPNPDIPESPEKVGKRLLSQQEISEYRYG